MNKVAHYNGFVGRCQQYGLTKQAADMLYKQAWAKDVLTDLILQSATKGGVLGAGSGLATSALVRALGGDDSGLGGAAVGGIAAALPSIELANAAADTMKLDNGLKSVGDTFRELVGEAPSKYQKLRRFKPLLARLGIGGLGIGAGIGAGYLGSKLLSTILRKKRRNA